MALKRPSSPRPLWHHILFYALMFGLAKVVSLLTFALFPPSASGATLLYKIFFWFVSMIIFFGVLRLFLWTPYFDKDDEENTEEA